MMNSSIEHIETRANMSDISLDNGDNGSQIALDPRVYLSSTPSVISTRKKQAFRLKNGMNVPHSRGSPQYLEFNKPSQVFSVLRKEVKAKRRISPIKVMNH